MNQENNLPNAVAFKVFMDNTYCVCICERKDENWDENDILYLKESPKSKELYAALHDTNFHVIFLNIEYVGDSLSISYENSSFLYKSEASIEMYVNDTFFSTIEEGYNKNYLWNI